MSRYMEYWDVEAADDDEASCWNALEAETRHQEWLSELLMKLAKIEEDRADDILEEADWDLAKAIDLARAQGLKISPKAATKAVAEVEAAEWGEDDDDEGEEG